MRAPFYCGGSADVAGPVGAEVLAQARRLPAPNRAAGREPLRCRPRARSWRSALCWRVAGLIGGRRHASPPPAPARCDSTLDARRTARGSRSRASAERPNGSCQNAPCNAIEPEKYCVHVHVIDAVALIARFGGGRPMPLATYFCLISKKPVGVSCPGSQWRRESRTRAGVAAIRHQRLLLEVHVHHGARLALSCGRLIGSATARNPPHIGPSLSL